MIALRMKPTCLFLSIFLFDSESFFNLHVFSLLFNKRHLYNRVSRGSLQEFFGLKKQTFSPTLIANDQTVCLMNCFTT